MLEKRDESSQSTRRRLNGIHAEREEKFKNQKKKKAEMKQQPMRRRSSVIRIYVTVGRPKLSVYIVADGHFHI
jgi:hypothetical protein